MGFFKKKNTALIKAKLSYWVFFSNLKSEIRNLNRRVWGVVITTNHYYCDLKGLFFKDQKKYEIISTRKSVSF